MLDGTAVKEIAGLAQGAQGAEARTLKIGEHTFSTTPLLHLPPKPESEPAALHFGSLGAMVEYVKANRDALDLKALVLLVESPTVVRLLGPIVGEKKQRFCYATATAKNLVEKWVDTYHPQEAFVVAMQSRFEDMHDRAAVLRVISKLREEQSLESEDDGVGQRATVKAGVVLATQVEVPNPVTLAPFRTFREVVQPGSQFVLRVQKGPSVALFEADGGSWQIDAVGAVAAWLSNEVSDIPVLR